MRPLRVAPLTHRSPDDIKALQSTGGENLAATEQNILGNDLLALWKLVSSPDFGLGDGKGGRIDFILDNAGRSRFTRIFADILLIILECDRIRTVLRSSLRGLLDADWSRSQSSLSLQIDRMVSFLCSSALDRTDARSILIGSYRM